MCVKNGISCGDHCFSYFSCELSVMQLKQTFIAVKIKLIKTSFKHLLKITNEINIFGFKNIIAQ